MNELKRLQEHLLLIRRTVGWTAEEFGERIGVTRQTINNLEAGRNKLNKTQYIAMRSVLDAEMNQYQEETEMLKLILDVFIDHPEIYGEEEKEKLLSKANMVAPSILAGSTSRKDVSKEMMAVAGGIGILATAASLFGPTAVIGGATSAWLFKTIFDKKQ
ncbi:MAG: helix-turn-helix transcriptional regulator [Lachnospiraceae bacterium]|nr:helix-turn-helix transcriptional regulator [Lachnospiraceae bacterium]